MDDLLGSLTDDDGIRADFVDAVRLAYDNDMGTHVTRIGELEGQLADSAAEQERLIRDHDAALTSLKASFYDQIQTGNVTTEVEATVVEPDVNEFDGPFYQEDN